VVQVVHLERQDQMVHQEVVEHLEQQELVD
jgi:hypothetical protein